MVYKERRGSSLCLCHLRAGEAERVERAGDPVRDEDPVPPIDVAEGMAADVTRVWLRGVLGVKSSHVCELVDVDNELWEMENDAWPPPPKWELCEMEDVESEGVEEVS